MHRRMEGSDWSLLGLLSVLWGGTFIVVEVLIDTLPPLSLTVARVGLSAVLLLALLRLGGTPLPRGWGLWGAFLVMGLLNNLLPQTLFAWGQIRLTGGLAAILNSTTPLFSVVLAHFLTREEGITPGRLLGVLFGIAGVAVLIGPQALGGLAGDLAAQLACLAASLSYALAAIWGLRFRGLPVMAIAAGQLTGATVLGLPAALWHDRPWTIALGAEAWLALAILVLFCTVLGYLIYFRLLVRAGATNVLLVTFLIPLSALALGHLWLGERIAAEDFLAMLLIFAGIACVDGRLPAWLGRRVGWGG